ncbi:MAG TPA: hypothetical protein VFT94_03275 [Gaiellaceae bacterium]|nr:hypothetical protein [Gaiellaceae bacterium]
MHTEHEHTDLIEEITRYLDAVELFRSVGCEPSWRPEPTRLAATDEAQLATIATASAH